ncbi:MAG: SBBP repeat-containing protein, partial [Bacteroidetes bacterium]|nr:SBBP repeat-containing protein [Bacteroidota bacterium]
MKKYFPAIILCYLLSQQISATENIGTKNEIAFLENKGQVYDQYYKARPDILFSCEANSIDYFLKNNGISYQLSRVDSWKEQKDLFKIPLGKKTINQVVDKMTIYRLDVHWLNANKNCMVQKEDALQGYSNYYFGFCPDGVNHVKSYKNITYKNVYNGIDLHYYSKNGNLKYDYIVAANTDYKQIQLKIDGAESITINKKGELLIKTPLGTIIEQAPLVKQNNKVLKAKWLVTNTVVSFKIEGIDPKKSFVIDPMIRLWGTLYGGTGTDSANATCVDGSDNIYIAGHSNSPSGIATVGSHQFTYGGGSMGDVILVKFDRNGVRNWATYYGGSNDDVAVGCATDKNRNIFITGGTYSSIGIATPGAFQTIKKGDADAFFAKFDSTGVRQWATYYGDSIDDGGSNCSVDPSGNVLFFGITEPPVSGGTVLATLGAHQTLSPNSISPDGFIAKFSTNGQRLWGTYYGGSQYDEVRAGAIDSHGNIYTAGQTNSYNNIATPGSHQFITPGLGGLGFLAKFDSMGVRQWGTYYGGNSLCGGLYCAVDRSDNIYMGGNTSLSASTTATDIATSGCHQNTIGGDDDAFLAKFNSSGLRIWSTYYGGDQSETGWCCATDKFNNIYLAGTCIGDTLAQGAIATPDGFQNTHGGVLHNAYIVKFDSNGVRKWGTFYG